MVVVMYWADGLQLERWLDAMLWLFPFSRWNFICYSLRSMHVPALGIIQPPWEYVCPYSGNRYYCLNAAKTSWKSSLIWIDKLGHNLNAQSWQVKWELHEIYLGSYGFLIGKFRRSNFIMSGEEAEEVQAQLHERPVKTVILLAMGSQLFKKKKSF